MSALNVTISENTTSKINTKDKNPILSQETGSMENEMHVLQNSFPQINRTGMDEDWMSSVAVDSNDNIYAAGFIEQFIPPSSVVYYGYISKISPISEIQWTYFFEDSIVGGIAVDSQDNAVVFGTTWNSNLPTTAGAFDRSFNSINSYDGDFFLAKFDSIGQIVWCTYLGGSGDDHVHWSKIAIDSQDNIIIAESTPSSDFPTKNAIQEEKSVYHDIIVCKFNSSGGLLWSTFLGGSGNDEAFSVAVDQEDNIYIAGNTNWLFPTTSNAYQRSLNGGFDNVLTKFNPQGSIVWSSYVGGSQDEWAGTATVSQDHLYLITKTMSSDFPAVNEYHGLWDMLLAKFDLDGDLIWCRYIGGTGNEVRNLPSIAIDLNGNIIITSSTLSSDFETKDAQFKDRSGGWDGILASYSPSGEVLWSTFYGGTGSEECFDVTIDSQNQIIMGGNVNFQASSTIDPFETISKLNAFEYSFDKEKDGFISKWDSNGTLLWSTLVSVIPYPENDNDDDGLTNYEEYQRCYDTSLLICTDPLDADTDNDGLDDAYELDIGINPVDQDTDGDKIHDGREVGVGTNPDNTDTDGDGMDDYWEYIHMLNGSYAGDALDDSDEDGLTNLAEYQFDTRLDPHNTDTDNDTMSDGWEVENGLDPINDDRNLDHDNDGLSNLEEYDLKTEPTDADTDGDGMPDGWEVKYDLDPHKRDAGKDADNDGLDNLNEYRLQQFGFKPNSETDTYFSIVLIFVAISSIIGFIFWLRKRNANVKLMGYESYPDYKTSLKQGFTSAKERSKAFSSGFLSKSVQNAINSAGYRIVADMITDWDNVVVRVAEEISTDQVNKHIQLISETTSPLNLDEVKINLDPFVKKLNQEMDQLRQIISLQQLLITLHEQSKIPLLEGLSKEDLDQYVSKYLSIVNELDQYHINIGNAINQREVWFKPWKALLTLIQITEDGMPIALSRISEVVNCSEAHAEDLIKLLLSENKYIGDYDENQKVYTKGVNIKDYIQMILSQLSDIKGN
jgi:hypothetical protein